MKDGDVTKLADAINKLAGSVNWLAYLLYMGIIFHACMTHH